MATGWPMKTTYANGDVYSASDVNDITGTINLLGSSVAYAAGKNKILNSDCSIWQRGTSYSVPTGATYGAADRFSYYHNGSTAGTNTISRQTFTPGTAPVSGYEGQYFQRWTATTLGTSQTLVSFEQAIENVQTFAGQTVTVSYWAKSSSAFTTDVVFRQYFGSGGSTSVDTNSGTSTTSTSWTRFSFAVSIPSISGKTIGTGSYLKPAFRFYTITAGATVDIWGVQVEQGSTATAFQTATGTIQGELAACQRYYIRYSASNTYSIFASSAYAISSTFGAGTFTFPVEMRTTPSAIDSSTLAFSKWDNTHYALTSPVLDGPTLTTKNAYVYGTISGATAGNTGYFGANNSTSAYIGFTAEL